MDPREFAAAQNREARRVTVRVRQVVARDGAPVTPAQREAMASALLPVVKRSRVRVRDLGVEFMQTQAANVGETLEPQPIRDYESQALVKVLERVTGVPDDGTTERRRVSVTMADPKTRSDVRKRVTVTEENRNDAVVKKVVGDRAAATVERHVRNAAREAISDAAELAGSEVGWARVLSGAESCPFCAMLASRGPAYNSAEAAGFVTQRSGRYDSREAKAYHDHCDCIVVPVFDGEPWYGQEHYELLEELWIESTRGLSAPDSTKAFAAALKKTNLTKLPDAENDGVDEMTAASTNRRAMDAETQRRDIASWLEAEAKYKADVAKWLAAEKKAKAAERRREAAARKRAADAKKVASRPGAPASSTASLEETRQVVETTRASIPHGTSGWDSFKTVKADVNGNWLPSDELKGHLDSVLIAGRAVREEVERRLATNPLRAQLLTERAKFDAEFAELSAIEDKWTKWGQTRKGRRPSKPQPTLAERFAIQDKQGDAGKRLAVIESAAIRDVLAEVRDFGGHRQTTYTPSPSDLSRLSEPKRAVTAVDQTAIDMLREAEAFYPTDWLKAADGRGPLGLGYADRGFFAKALQGRVARDVITLSDPNRPDATAQYYTGAHGNQETETMIHELGHRMEDSVPGLTQLEFALARSRATKNGELEPLRAVAEQAGVMEGEEGYADEWKNAYAGKSYSQQGDRRPDLQYHEVFQTGTQDLFGRSRSKFGDEQSEEFMLGVLATL